MSSVIAARRAWERLGAASRQHLLLRGLSLLAGLTFLALVRWAGGDDHPLMSLALVVVLVVVLLLPDSAAPLLLVLGLGGLWVVSVPESLSVWTLLAALDLLLLHVSCTLASYGPPQLTLGRVMLLLWAGRATLMAGVAGLTWLAGRWIGAQDPPAAGLLTAAALALLIGWTVLLSRRLVSRDAAEHP